MTDPTPQTPAPTQAERMVLVPLAVYNRLLTFWSELQQDAREEGATYHAHVHELWSELENAALAAAQPAPALASAEEESQTEPCAHCVTCAHWEEGSPEDWRGFSWVPGICGGGVAYGSNPKGMGNVFFLSEGEEWEPLWTPPDFGCPNHMLAQAQAEGGK